MVKFDQRIPLKLDGDSCVIVAAIGQRLTLARVIGADFGQLPPVVVRNPIFVSVTD